MSKTKIINLPVHFEDALLLIGVLEHAINEGERNLETLRKDPTAFDVSVNDTFSMLMRMRSWVDVLQRGEPSDRGLRADALYLEPKLKKFTVCYTRIPTSYNDQKRMVVEAENADAARELVQERLGDRGKTFHTYHIEKVKPYEPVASHGRIVEGG